MRVRGGPYARPLPAQPGRGELLAGIGDPRRVERAAQPVHRVEVVGAELPGHPGLLLQPDAVLARDRPARVDAQVEDAEAEFLRGAVGAGHGVVEEDERVQIAVAGVEDVRHADARGVGQTGRSR